VCGKTPYDAQLPWHHHTGKVVLGSVLPVIREGIMLQKRNSKTRKSNINT